MTRRPLKHPLIMSPILLAAALVGGGCNLNDQKAETGPAQALAAQSFKREWAADLALKNDEVARVFALGDLVIAYTKNQHAYVINRGSGLIRFSARMTDSKVSPKNPALLKERIVFPTISTLEIYRLDGRLQLSYPTKHSIRTNAAGEPNGSRLFVGVDVPSLSGGTPGSGRVVCYNTASGTSQGIRQVWELMSDKGAAVDSAPAIVQGIVYVAFADGWVYAVNADTRQGIWATSQGAQFRTFGPIQADLRADDAGVYVASTDTKFYCLDRNTGNTKWDYHAGISLREAPEVSPTTVYLPVYGKGLLAFDKATGPKNGQPRWTYRDGVKMVSEDEKYSYIQRKDNSIAALDKVTGEPVFQNQRKDLVAFATNNKGDGLIYAATRDGQVMAIAPVLKPGFMGEVAWVPVTKDEALAMK
jgi:outer membrane protein assembly factor BamB